MADISASPAPSERAPLMPGGNSRDRDSVISMMSENAAPTKVLFSMICGAICVITLVLASLWSIPVIFSQNLVGTCILTQCINGRNADCERGRCACRKGYEGMDGDWFGQGGLCAIPETPTWKARVHQIDKGHPQFPEIHGKTKTAICLSGGGARAASQSLGALRALEGLGLMESVDGMSAISGSLFVAIPYMFAKPDGHALHGGRAGVYGKSLEPEALTLEKLKSNCGDIAMKFAGDPVMGTVGRFMSSVAPHLTGVRKHLSAEWRNLMRSQFLDHWGLGDEDCFMALDNESEARIKKKNPALKDWCFNKPLPGKPKVFVIGAAILSEASDSHTDAASFQISPDWSGSPFFVNISGADYTHAWGSARLSDDVVGGGMVETFAFGGDEPESQTSGEQEFPPPRRPFGLADAMAMATYADFLPEPSTYFSHLPKDMWTPSYMYWPVGKGEHQAERFAMGDGGFVEDTGLLAMLQRQTPKIATFMFGGSNQQVVLAVPWCQHVEDVRNGTFDPSTFDPRNETVVDGKRVVKALISESIYTIYGYPYDDGTFHKTHNQVFPQEEMFTLGCELSKLKQRGEAQVVKMTQDVLENKYWGIRPYTVEIIYVVNDVIPNFVERLPEETQEELKGGMGGFPMDIAAGLYMEPKVINLMAAQAEYMVMENKDLFRELLS